ncbi:type-F conjugative transfer system protein TraW [Methylibium sp.]|uniref:type-F conjugative transfer system protein TraW n=1 Tax=Methylibium sp. TaxID=2067992 RepID=UPI003BA9F5B0
MKTVRRPVLAIALVLGSTGVWSADLGTIGPTYGIREPHLLNFIEQRLRDKERSGEMQQLIAQAQARGIDAVKRPQPVAGLQPTATARTFYFDPSFTLDRNVTDASGQLLFAAGTRKNPLDVVSLSKHLLFFDARDRRQVARAQELMARYAGKVKPILTGGSYLDLMKVWRIPVYYDQQGTLTRRFGIRQVPALVSQEGARLRIDEVVLP